MGEKVNSFNWPCVFSESTNRGGLVGTRHHLLATTNLLLGCQLKNTQTHRETRIAHMDQSRISNRSSTVKDNDNIHSSIPDQSYISTRVFYEKQMHAKLEEGPSFLKGTCFDLCFPKLRNIQFLKRKIISWSWSSFGQRTWYYTYVPLTHVIIEVKK